MPVTTNIATYVDIPTVVMHNLPILTRTWEQFNLLKVPNVIVIGYT